MDKRELLKSMLNNLINDRSEEAALDFHNYLTPKTREIAGIGTNEFDETQIDEARAHVKKSTEPVKVKIDWYSDSAETKDDVIKEIEQQIKKAKLNNIEFNVVTMTGPGGGLPSIRVTGPYNEIHKFLLATGNEEGVEAYKS